MARPDIDLQKYSATRIALFISNPLLKQHVEMSLKTLGFHDVNSSEVPRNYFQAIGKLVPLVAGGTGLVLVNLPPKPRPATAGKDVVPIYDEIREMYLDLKTNLAKRNSDPLKLLSKTVPVLEVGDYLREKLVEVLFKFRVPAAFFLSTPEATRHLSGPKKNQVARRNFETHFGELQNYLMEYFRDRDEVVAAMDMKLSEKELTERKKQYDDLMVEAEKLKQEGNYESAIQMLRKAIEVFPKDIEAYLESGRLYVRRREYGRALGRFSQAEELFSDAPAPNKEIANVRLTQVKEKIESGMDPQNPEIMELMKEATANYETAHQKAVEMTSKAPERPELNHPTSIGHEILKWNLSDLLGPKHPGVRALTALAQKTTEGLQGLPLADLSTNQLLALGLQAVESGDVTQAKKYYFYALTDRVRFDDVCTEINLMGIRLRAMGLIDEAIDVYRRLLRHNPHNLGFVYWNLAVAYAYRQEMLHAAGHIVLALYTDSALAKEEEFYTTLTPQLSAVFMRLLRAIRLVVKQARESRPSPQLVKLYKARDSVERFARQGKKSEALRLLLALLRQASAFTVKPEFHGDGVILEFVRGLTGQLNAAKDPGAQNAARVLTKWMAYVEKHPAPPALVKHLKLTQAATQSMEESGDQRQSAHLLAQSLLVVPESYFSQPDFFAQETLPDLLMEMTSKFKFVNTQRFPRPATANGQQRKKGAA